MNQYDVFIYLKSSYALVRGVKTPFYKDDENVMAYAESDSVIIPLEFALCALGEKEIPKSIKTVIKNSHAYAELSDIAEHFGKNYFYDRCGYVIIGDFEDLTLEDAELRARLAEYASELVFERPDAKSIVEKLKKNNPEKQHPRILLREEGFDYLRGLIGKNKQFTEIYNKITELAEKQLTFSKLKHELRDGIRLLYVSREALVKIVTLSLCYRLCGKAEYKNAAIETMLNVCSFPDWNPRHFLDTAEMATAVAIGYDWLYDCLNESERSLIRKTIANYALKEIMRDFTLDATRERTWGWSDPNNPAFPNNWIAVCSGGCSLAALAIGDEESPELCSEVISHGIRLEEYLLRKFAPDGAWYEGPVYWEYAMKYLSFHIHSLRSALGSDFGLSKSVGLENAANCFIDLIGAGGCFNLDDASSSLRASSAIMACAKLFNKTSLASQRINQINKGAEISPYDLIYYTPCSGNYDSSTLPNDAYYRECSIVTMRDGRGDRDMFFGFHGGEDGRGHCHLDSGSFIFDCFGKRWALDPGVEPKTYHGAKNRYIYYRYRAEGHNTFIINPKGEDDQDRSAVPYMKNYESHDGYAYAVADLTVLYEKSGANSATRGVLMDKIGKYVLIRDRISSDEPIEYYWFMHTAADIAILNNGKRATLSIEGEKIELEILSDGGTFETREALPLPVSPFPEDSVDNSAFKKLTVHIEKAESIDTVIAIKTQNSKITSKYLNLLI